MLCHYVIYKFTICTDIDIGVDDGSIWRALCAKADLIVLAIVSWFSKLFLPAVFS